MAMPFHLRTKKPLDCIDEHNDEQDQEYQGIHRLKVQFMKFWPSQGIKQAWRNYLLRDGQHLACLSVCIKLLDTVLEQHIVRQREAQLKKEQKEQKAKGMEVEPVKNAKQDRTAAVQRDNSKAPKYYFTSSEEEDDSDDDESNKKKKK